MSIRNYEVIKPPTSGEVEERILRDIAQHAPTTRLYIRAVEGDIPRMDDEFDLEFRVHATLHPHEGGMKITGNTSVGRTVNLVTSPTPEMAATLSLVTAD